MTVTRCNVGLKARPLFLSLTLSVAAGMWTPVATSAQPSAPEPVAGTYTPVEVDPALWSQVQARSTASMLVYFSQRADLSATFQMDWQARGHYVYGQLTAAAESAQKDLLDYLAAHGIEHQPFWIDNVVHIRNGDLALLNRLTDPNAFSGIRSILGEQDVFLIEPEAVVEAPLPRATAIANIEHINAPEVWNLGFTGQGITVASIDTGVRHTHAALVAQYRGTIGAGQYDHAYNWWDPYTNAPVPFDTHNHGSHVTGTMVGDGGEGFRIGVAPDSKWIHCQGFNPGSTNAALLECGQFMAAPWNLDGENADPDRRPHVVNNSWGDCLRESNHWYDGVIDAWIAAGIVPIFANGNAGNCQYTRPPGLNTIGNPARSGKVISVGSTGVDNGLYASHSNWGPTDSPSPGLPMYPDHFGFPSIKPNVVAPGVSVLSAGRGDDQAYYLSTGTSMSAPHVAGLVALMWEAAPCLIGDHATTGTLLMAAANPVPYDSGGSPPVGPGNVPNYATGWGEIDAMAAVSAALAACGGFTIAGAPPSARICAAGEAAFDIRLTRHGAFDDPVTLTVDAGLPSDLLAAFSPNPLVPTDPAATSVLTVGAPTGHPGGSYTLTILAESAGPDHPPETKSSTLGLRVDATPLAAPSLTQPADGAADVVIRPEFSWSGVSGESYRIQVDSSPAFTAPVIDELMVATTFRPTTGLSTGTTYHWRVLGENACGAGSWSATRSFSTRFDPVGRVLPSSLGYVLTEDASQSSELAVSNLGTADLAWSINAANLNSGSRDDEESWRFIGPSGGDIRSIGISPMDPDIMLAGVVPTLPANGKLYRSTDGGASWSESFANNGVHRIVFAPDGTAYLGTHLGVRKSTDGGATWSTLNLGIGTSQQVVGLAIAPNNPAIVYAGIAESIGTQPSNLIRSTDAGVTWQNVTPPLGGAMNGRAIAIHPTDPDTVIALFDLASGTRQVWVSTDGAATWQNRSAGLPNNPLRAVHYDGDRLLVGGGQAFNSQFVGLYESYDLGQNWTALQIANPPPFVESIAVDPQDPDRIYVAASGTGVHRSLDGGVTWETGIGGTGGISTTSIAFVPGYSNQLLAGALALGVLRTENAGDTFLSHGNGISEITLYSTHVNPLNSEEIAVAFQAQNTGGIYTTTNGGDDWILEATPAVRFDAVIYADDGTLYALANGPTTIAKEALYRREANGGWTHLGPDQGGGTAWLSDLKAIRFGKHNPDLILLGGKDNGVAGTEATIWRSADRGSTWSKVYEVGSNYRVTAIEVIDDGSDQNIVASWSGSNFGGVIRSTDGGVTWSPSSEGLPGNVSFNNVRMCTHPHTPERVFLAIGATAASPLFRSDDAGVTWTPTGWSNAALAMDLACDPVDEAVLYMTHNRSGFPIIWRSDDYGVTFQPYVNGMPQGVLQPRSLAFKGDSDLIVATSRGTFQTSLGGEARACSDPRDIPWLSFSPESGSTAPGTTDEVAVSVDSTGLEIGQYRAQLCFNTNDPDSELIRVPVEVTVANEQLGTLAGQVTAEGYCASGAAPAAGAQITVVGQHSTFELVANGNGQFTATIDVVESPLSVTARYAGHIDASQDGIVLAPAATTSVDLGVALDAPCLDVSPNALTLDVESGDIESATLRIDNANGAGILNWSLATALPDGSPAALRTPATIDSTPSAAGQSTVSSLDEALPSIRAIGMTSGGFDCTAGSGLIVNDDGTVEQGWGASPDLVQRVTMVDYFVPASYPITIDAICLVLLSQGPTSTDFQVVVYADDGENGQPGQELAVISATASDLPVVPPLPPMLPWQSVDLSALNLRLSSGGIYLGLRWTPTIPNVLIGGDTSPGNPPNAGAGYRRHDDGGWIPLAASFTEYRAMFVRAIASDASGCTAPSTVDWLTVSASSGSVDPGSWIELTITTDSTGLDIGTHEASLCLDSNDPERPVVVIPVTLNVSPDPEAPATLALLSGSGQTTAVNSAFSTPLSIQVLSGHGQPLANVEVEFNPPEQGASALLSQARLSTDDNGYASVTATANAHAGSYEVHAHVDGLAPVTFALTNASATTDLAIEVRSLRDYVRRGQVVDYLVTVRNLGPDSAEQARVAGTLSDGLDEAFAHWQCLGPVGSLCTASGQGHLDDDGLLVESGGSVNYLLSAPVQWTADGFASVAGTVTHASDTDPSNNAHDASSVIVVYRDGFERYGTMADLHRIETPLDGDQALGFTVGAPNDAPLETLLAAGPASASASPSDIVFRIQRLNEAGGPWLRIVALDGAGQEYASRWIQTAAGGEWQLVFIDTQTLDDEGESTTSRSLRLSAGPHDVLLPLMTSPARYTLWSTSEITARYELRRD